ncbi:MAG TPA: MFS transporter [Phenylobacterium sp.]|nr:MFS transporter [Phenylobacterium sp.]
MAFFRNDAVNRVIAHSGVVAFAQGAGGLYFFAFLLKAGVSIPLALLAQAATVAGRFAVRPLLLPLARRFGVKRLLIAGDLILACQYPVLAQVHGLGPALVALVVVSGLGEVFYWLSYNAYYAAVGDAEHRGRQVAAREALLALIGIAAPLAGAAALVAAGPRWAFGAVGLVQALAVLPLLGAPEVSVKAEAPGALRAARPAIPLMVADGWFDSCYLFIWQIALFITLKQSFSAYGGAMALAGVVGAAAALWLGPRIDAGHGRRAVVIAYSLSVTVVLLRAASLGWPALAVAANAAGALLFPVMIPVLVTVTANLSKASPCSLRFSMVTEGSWDVGCFLACLTGAALFAAGAPLVVGVLLAIPATLVQGWRLWRIYPPRPAAVAA